MDKMPERKTSRECERYIERKTDIKMGRNTNKWTKMDRLIYG